MTTACARWLLTALLALAADSARAQAVAPTRIVVAIGQDVGAPEDEALRYAERDARRFAELLVALGDVEPRRTYLVTDASAERVRQVFTEVRGRAMELPDVVLIAYVSGHGDESALRLGPSRLPHEELRALLASIPARLRLLVVDTCTSGALIRSKGGKAVQPFAIDLERGQAIEGQVVITSTGPHEPAQEWEALGGALFTHHLLSALRGAADHDGDGRVTLFEAYGYAYDRTLSASSTARGGAQHPSHLFDLRGAGDLVLTRPGGRSSGLLLGRALSGRYVITHAHSGELTAELDKVSGRPLRLSLEPGRYLVRKPLGAFVSVGEVTVLPSALVEIDERDFDQVPYAEVARRGAGPLRLWSLEVAGGISSGALAGSGPTPRLGVLLARELGPWAVSAGLEVGMASFRATQLAIEQRELWGAIALHRRAPLGWLMPYLSLRVGLGLLHQSLTRDQEATIRQVLGAAALPNRNGVAAETTLAAGLELPLSRVLLRLEAHGGLTFIDSERGAEARPLALLRLGGGWRF